MAAANGSNGNGSTTSASLSSVDLMNVILGNGGGANGNGNGGGAAVAADAAAALAAATAGMSYSQTSELLAWVMDRAEVLRRKVRVTVWARCGRQRTGDNARCGLWLRSVGSTGGTGGRVLKEC